MKQRWLNKKEGGAVPLNPYEMELVKQTKGSSLKKKRYKGANVVGAPRDPFVLYRENPMLLYKVS